MTSRPVLLLVLLAGLASCRAGGPSVSLTLPEAPKPLASDLVAREVGQLLSADPAASRAAEQRLTALDSEGRSMLLRHAERIPQERDPRWLLVLEENHALPPMPPAEEIAYLLWKAARPEPFYEMKAQGRLLELARAQPDAMVEALETADQGVEVLAVALALAREPRAFPPLRTLYAEAETARERRVAAEALRELSGGELTPSALGSEADVRAELERIDAWGAARRSEEVE